MSVRLKAPDRNAHLMVFVMVNKGSKNKSEDLAADGSDGCAFNSHGRKACKSEDQYRVHNNIENGSGALGDHAVEGLSGRLEDALKHHFSQDAKAENTDDLKIFDAVFNDNWVGGLAFKEQSGAEDPEQSEKEEAYKGQEKAIGSSQIGAFVILFSQRA